MKRIVLVLLLAIAGLPAAAKVSAPAIFGDNMVLQQQQNVRLWGGSDAREVVVKTSWSGEEFRTPVKEGRWELKVPTPAGSYEPQTLTVSDADSELKWHNVLIGEVWICSGQSNMYMPLRGYTGQPVDEALSTVLEAGEYRGRIRMITLPKREAATPQHDFEGRWEVPAPETALRMSATAYFFARTLTQALGVPVGIVSTSWGGSKIEAWIDTATLAGLGYDAAKINADPKIEPRAKCGLLYNGLVAPVAGFTARGFAWYQGESNRKEAARYARLMEGLAACWRAQWGDDKNRMPFLYVQIRPGQRTLHPPSQQTPRGRTAGGRSADESLQTQTGRRIGRTIRRRGVRRRQGPRAVRQRPIRSDSANRRSDGIRNSGPRRQVLPCHGPHRDVETLGRSLGTRSTRSGSGALLVPQLRPWQPGQHIGHAGDPVSDGQSHKMNNRYLSAKNTQLAFRRL